MSNKIKKAANKFRRQLKGIITFETVENRLKKTGYKVIFFNTPTGEAELERYHLTETARTTNAFTYCSTAKIIFINNLLSAEDKLYALLHEAAHIILKHLDIERLSVHSSILLDIDADAFVHYLLNPQTAARKAVAICSIIAVAAVSAALCNTVMYTDTASETGIVTQSVSVVYITSTGRKFHTENCGAITGRAVARIERDEAVKIHEPCMLCNP